MIGQFPGAWCTDGGWPVTLQGIAKEFFEFWKRDLKPRGFGLRVEIVSYPEGKPGDIGPFLSWTAQTDPPDGAA